VKNPFELEWHRGSPPAAKEVPPGSSILVWVSTIQGLKDIRTLYAEKGTHGAAWSDDLGLPFSLMKDEAITWWAWLKKKAQS
jgi:hypothetical protein